MKILRILPVLIVSMATMDVSRACPDCALKSSGGIIEPQTVTAKVALSDNTLLMILVVLGVLGFLIWSMVRTLRELEAQRSLSAGPTRS